MSDETRPLSEILPSQLIAFPGGREQPSKEDTTWTATLHLLPDVGVFYEEYAAHLGLSPETLLTLIVMGMVAVLDSGGCVIP